MLSIVIPTKNEEHLLPILLESIHQQTFKEVEIIVADAGSDDSTVEIAKIFGAKVVVGGLPGVGRNRGAEVAKGEYILFLDADVELTDSEHLVKIVKEAKNKKLDIATCDVEPLTHKRIDHVLHGLYNSYARAWGSVLPHAPGFFMLVKRSLHEKIGGFDETIIFCEDHDYARRAAKVGHFGFLQNCRIPVSTRRLERDGRFGVAMKFALAELHLVTLGPIRHKMFDYTFGHKK